jgi:two-component system, OmpR family, sensor histidine kinase KdpD
MAPGVVVSQRIWRSLLSLAGVAAVTVAAYRVIPVNATTAGFAYLLLVLVLASTWGFVEAAVASVAATLTFNFFFLPPVGTFTIRDPQNVVAFFSFLTTSLIASRLSAAARRTASNAIERQRDLERLYTFSRAILLIDDSAPFGKQLIQKVTEVFKLNASVLYERHTGAFYRAGPQDFEGLDAQLRDAALHNATYSDAEKRRLITTIRLGSEPIGSIALEGALMPDAVLQGMANLVAIGLERAKAQDMAQQVEAARQSEQLRTALLDAMAHEFKTPLTSIKAATTALLDSPGQPEESRAELLRVADEEADRLGDLIDHSLEMARLESQQFEVHKRPIDVVEAVADVVRAMPADGRRIDFLREAPIPPIAADTRLLRMAIKQVLDNALKYSPPQSPVTVRVRPGSLPAGAAVAIEITDRGEGIPVHEQSRIFERFYRSPSVKRLIPGSGLGLSIVDSIVRAHNGELSVSSRPGETTFRVILPANGVGGVSGERN